MLVLVLDEHLLRDRIGGLLAIPVKRKHHRASYVFAAAFAQPLSAHFSFTNLILLRKSL